MSEKLSASVVIPTIDEEQIRDVISVILSTCNSTDIKEIIIIYSKITPPDFIEYLLCLKDAFPKVKIIIEEQPNSGPGDAAFFGCSIAGGTHVVILGADMENDPGDICKMIELAKNSPDTIIKASRRLKKETFENYPKIKKIFNVAFQKLICAAFSSNQTDITYAYQLTPANYLKKFGFMPDHGAFAIELALLPELYNIPYIEIPSRVGRRTSGKSHTNFKYYLGYLITGAKIYYHARGHKN
ncbi:MAG: glycosyltransferase [Oscillospiraceae bacterium]|nr:glycosyltransferase [Oscillospiraceae bacterium]